MPTQEDVSAKRNPRRRSRRGSAGCTAARSRSGAGLRPPQTRQAGSSSSGSSGKKKVSPELVRNPFRRSCAMVDVLPRQVVPPRDLRHRRPAHTSLRKHLELLIPGPAPPSPDADDHLMAHPCPRSIRRRQRRSTRPDPLARQAVLSGRLQRALGLLEDSTSAVEVAQPGTRAHDGCRGPPPEGGGVETGLFGFSGLGCSMLTDRAERGS